jgi:hypothetical protein
MTDFKVFFSQKSRILEMTSSGMSKKLKVILIGKILSNQNFILPNERISFESKKS